MKKILLALLTSCALVSCEGYFDQLPKTELPSETFYTSYDAALRNVETAEADHCMRERSGKSAVCPGTLSGL